MSRTLNKVMLIGNVGGDPELKRTPGGIPVTSFRLATTETWKDKDGRTQEHTDWHTVVAWRGLAEIIHKLVSKGSRIYIEGKIQTRNFDDRVGSRRHVVEILAESMLMLEQKKGSGYDKEDDNVDDFKSTSEDDDNYEESISDNSDDESGKSINAFLF